MLATFQHRAATGLNGPGKRAVAQGGGQVVGNIEFHGLCPVAELEERDDGLVDLGHFVVGRLGPQVEADNGFGPQGGRGIHEMELEIAGDAARGEAEAFAHLGQHVGLVSLAGGDVLGEIAGPFAAEADELSGVVLSHLDLPPEDVLGRERGFAEGRRIVLGHGFVAVEPLGAVLAHGDQPGGVAELGEFPDAGGVVIPAGIGVEVINHIAPEGFGNRIAGGAASVVVAADGGDDALRVHRQDGLDDEGGVKAGFVAEGQEDDARVVVADAGQRRAGVGQRGEGFGRVPVAAAALVLLGHHPESVQQFADFGEADVLTHADGVVVGGLEQEHCFGELLRLAPIPEEVERRGDIGAAQEDGLAVEEEHSLGQPRARVLPGDEAEGAAAEQDIPGVHNSPGVAEDCTTAVKARGLRGPALRAGHGDGQSLSAGALRDGPGEGLPVGLAAKVLRQDGDLKFELRGGGGVRFNGDFGFAVRRIAARKDVPDGGFAGGFEEYLAVDAEPAAEMGGLSLIIRD